MHTKSDNIEIIMGSQGIIWNLGQRPEEQKRAQKRALRTVKGHFDW